MRYTRKWRYSKLGFGILLNLVNFPVHATNIFEWTRWKDSQRFSWLITEAQKELTLELQETQETHSKHLEIKSSSKLASKLGQTSFPRRASAIHELKTELLRDTLISDGTSQESAQKFIDENWGVPSTFLGSNLISGRTIVLPLFFLGLGEADTCLAAEDLALEDVRRRVLSTCRELPHLSHCRIFSAVSASTDKLSKSCVVTIEARLVATIAQTIRKYENIRDWIELSQKESDFFTKQHRDRLDVQFQVLQRMAEDKETPSP